MNKLAEKNMNANASQLPGSQGGRLRGKPGGPRRQRAFTFVELLTVLAVIIILAAVVLPAFARTKPSVQRMQCLNNLGELMRNILVYTHDYHDLFPPNPDDGNSLVAPPHEWVGGEAGGGGNELPQARTFCPGILADPNASAIANETGKSVSLFHCPSDLRTGPYQPDPPYFTNILIGTIVPSARSYSMNGAVGSICAEFNSGSGHGGPLTYPVNGPWLTGSHGQNRHNNPWRTYGKTTDMVAPIPANLFVLADENPQSINDGALSLSVGTPEWVDYPGISHNLGCVFAFGDGHAELHHWAGTTLPLNGGGAYIQSVPATDPDWLWVSQRTSALAK